MSKRSLTKVYSVVSFMSNIIIILKEISIRSIGLEKGCSDRKTDKNLAEECIIKFIAIRCGRIDLLRSFESRRVKQNNIFY